MKLMVSQRRNTTRRQRRGTNAIEFALTAPILFFLILGTMDFGWFFMHHALLDAATQEAARVGSIASDSAGTSLVDSVDWEQSGSDTWTDFGIAGTPTFTTTISNTGTVSMINVTGTMDYNSFGGWDKLLGNIQGLPSTITVTVTRRLANQ